MCEFIPRRDDLLPFNVNNETCETSLTLRSNELDKLDYAQPVANDNFRSLAHRIWQWNN